jgi:hypothetical protein
MDSIGLIWILTGAFSFVLGVVLSVMFTTILNRHTNELIPISVTTRKRVANYQHR